MAQMIDENAIFYFECEVIFLSNSAICASLSLAISISASTSIAILSFVFSFIILVPFFVRGSNNIIELSFYYFNSRDVQKPMREIYVVKHEKSDFSDSVCDKIKREYFLERSWCNE